MLRNAHILAGLLATALAARAELPTAPVGVPPEGAEAERMAELARAFQGFDMDGDGSPEIAGLEPLQQAGEAGARVLLLVEARLTRPLEGAPALAPGLEQLVLDLAGEGYRAASLAVELGVSARHQDGLELLALREFLRSVAADAPLAGVILIGHFPDAFVVRTCNWRKRGDLRLRAGQPDEAVYSAVPYLRRVPEDVAHKADIVLADLDGRWEEVYVRPRTRLRTVLAVYPAGVPSSGGECADLELGSVEYEDFFHVSDGKLELSETLAPDGSVAGHALFLDDESAGHECSRAEAALPNGLAQPDILVSRLDARGSALSPRTDIRGLAGEGLLDEEGRPRSVHFGSREAVPDWRARIFEPDARLERELLASFLERDHAYRSGQGPLAFRPSSIACGLGSGLDEMARAAAGWAPSDPARCDPSGQPTLVNFVDWIAYPAVLRTLRAHSDAWGSVFHAAPVAELAEHLGGPAWSWTPVEDRLEPSLEAACRGGKLDWYLLRTLWQNGVVASEPAFYVHTGCNGISPPGAQRLAFDAPGYGLRQGGEALLLFGNGLALVGRAKVFYDEPSGFAQALAKGATFGAAWARYFELEAQAASWSQAGGDIGRKRAYFWSVLGDWTLTLAMARATH